MSQERVLIDKNVIKNTLKKSIDMSIEQAYGWSTHPTPCGVGDA
jgi:hypothetical protein